MQDLFIDHDIVRQECSNGVVIFRRRYPGEPRQILRIAPLPPVDLGDSMVAAAAVMEAFRREACAALGIPARYFEEQS